MSAIQLSQIRKDFGNVKVIHGVDIDIEDGEFVVFVGPSGCGKSTLLRLVAGLEEITSGELSIGGEVVNDLSPKDRGIAMVFQSYALYPHMTVYKNMAFGLKWANSTKREIDARVRDVAKILQLETLLDRRPAQLSGGQRQRVAIGRAIVRNPKVFLFDEPLSNLDAALRVQTRIEIAKLHEDLKSTIIYVTHDQVEAMTLADKIVVLNQGNVEQIGSPLELYNYPQNLFVAGFIGSPKMNFIEASVSAVGTDSIELRLGEGAPFSISCNPEGLRAGDKLTLGIRPEHMSEGGSGAVTLQGHVDVVEHLGDVSYLYMTLHDGTALIVSSQGTSRASSRQELSVSAEDNAIHIFSGDGRAVARPGVERE